MTNLTGRIAFLLFVSSYGFIFSRNVNHPNRYDCFEVQLAGTGHVRLMVLFSVLIPAFNKCSYLARSIESVFNIGLDENSVEIIVCDDHSVDCTYDLVEEYASRHKNLVYIRNDVRAGTFETRVRLVEHSHGKYLTFLDADDALVPEGVINALEIIQNEEREMVEFKCRALRAANETRYHSCWMPSKIGRTGAGPYRQKLTTGKTNWNVARKIFYTDMYKKGLTLIPERIRSMRICIAEDFLHMVYATWFMVKQVRIINSVGYEWHTYASNNSRSGAYESKGLIARRGAIVSRLCRDLLRTGPKSTGGRLTYSERAVTLAYDRFYGSWPCENSTN